MEERPEREAPLTGIHVLDLTSGAAGLCSRLLADLGARVVKVEPPGGDPARLAGPFLPEPHGDISLSFLYHNAGKFGITVDRENAEAKRLFSRLLKGSDILVENAPPGDRDGAGIDIDALRAAHPRLIVVSLSAFGRTGPRARFRACDLAAAAWGGLMAVTGSPPSPPLAPYGDQPSYTASLFGAAGALLALRKRRQTGRGEHVDISLQEAAAAALDHVFTRFFSEGTVARRQGNRHWNGLFRILPCRDGHVLVSPAIHFETLVSWMASEAMAGELTGEQWREEAYRAEHEERLAAIMAQWTKTHTKEELFSLGQALQLPWAPVCTVREVLGHVQLRERRFFRDMVSYPGAEDPLPFPGPPWRFGDGKDTPVRRAPAVGQDNGTICGEAMGTAAAEMGDPGTPAGGQRREAYAGDCTLAGIRILDFTRVLAGPFATRLLADFGADVIKVQPPGERGGGAPVMTDYYRMWNRNKRSITLDMNRAEGRTFAERLVAVSDVVIENFSPRVMANWGLTWERLREVRPDLVMVRMSAMGQTGPWRDMVAYAPTLHALTGFSDLTAFTRAEPAGPGFSYADTVAGLYAALAVLAALEDRDHSGKGQCIDLSEMEALCTFLGPALLESAARGEDIPPRGNTPAHVTAAPHGCYRCAGGDRWCVIAAYTEEDWQGLCDAMDRPAWTKETRFASRERRRQHRETLDGLIETWTQRYPVEDVVSLLQRRGLSAGPVQDARDLARDPHLRERGFFVVLTDATGKRTDADRSALRMRDGERKHWTTAPLPGEDNRAVYQELLGMSEEEYRHAVTAGIIG